MLPRAEENGREFEMQMHLKPQVHFFFFLFLFSSFLDYTNNYLQMVDMYSHHHHCSTRKQQQQGLEMAHLKPLVQFFFSIIFSFFSFICILSFNLFPPLFVLSICNYCICWIMNRAGSEVLSNRSPYLCLSLPYCMYYQRSHFHFFSFLHFMAFILFTYIQLIK